MIKIVICHDNERIAGQLQELIVSYTHFDDPVRVVTCLSGSELPTDRDKTSEPDIVIMAYRQGKSTQKEEAEAGAIITKNGPQTVIIYLLSDSDQPDRINDAEPVVYLRKPFNRETVEAALDQALSLRRAASGNYYYFTYGGIERRIDLNEVLYIESSYKIVRAKMKDSFSVRISGRDGKSFREVCGDLEAEYPVFCQPKKSLIVNALYIEDISETSLKVADREFRISPEYQEECLKRRIEAIVSSRYYRNA